MAYTLSRTKSGAIIFYDTYEFRWVDAWGSNVVKYLRDFGSLAIDCMNMPLEWDCELTETGTSSTTVDLNTVAGGELLITTDDAENDGINMQLKGEAFKCESAMPIYFGIRAKLSEATQTDFLAGLCITDTDLLGGMTDGIYFECLDGSTDTNFVTEKDSTETTSSASLGTMDTSYHIYEFIWDGGTTVTPYYDGTEKTVHTTNVPDDEELTPSIAFLNGDANSRTLSIDWIRIIHLRSIS